MPDTRRMDDRPIVAFSTLKNEIAGRPATPKTLAEIQARVMQWLQTEAGFAQVVTINRAGFPVGRTMGAPINPDWSVDLIQRRVHKRIGQLRRNPKLEIIWSGPPAPDNVNDRPHVYDFGLNAPRVVFLRGIAEFMDDATLIARYQRQTAIHRAKGQTRAPLRDPANIVAELIGVHVRPLQVRAEGFGDGAESFTWTFAETP
ncbi:MAG: hypothetical protein NZ518_04480 [Dehalococcoidia bacterium]|nr:hypothetical protein [Dehalococcoidia bacterium]